MSDRVRESEFNDAFTKIDRLNRIRMALHTSRRLGDDNDCLSLLYSYRSELDHRLTKEEKNKADMWEAKIKMEMRGYKKINVMTGKVSYKKGNYRSSIFNYELYLADRAEKYGLGMPDKKSMFDDVE